MEIFRTESEINMLTCEKHEEGENWQRINNTKVLGGMILTGLSDIEHDNVLNILENLDPFGLRGFMMTLIVEDDDGNIIEDDNNPKHINLLAMPTKDQIIRHHDQYYVVNKVLQSTSLSMAIFVKRISCLTPIKERNNHVSN